jgi:hypothetical protein
MNRRLNEDSRKGQATSGLPNEGLDPQGTHPRQKQLRPEGATAPVAQNPTEESGAGNELILASIAELPGDHRDRWNTVLSLLLE